MEETHKIYIDRLRKGLSEQIELDLEPSFMKVQEKELIFDKPIHIEGEAYLAENDLIIKISITTVAKMTCSICNKLSPYTIDIKDLTHVVPIDEIKGHIFELPPFIREAILLEVPFVVECSNGKCPERSQIQKFLADPKKKQTDEGYRPFKDL